MLQKSSVLCAVLSAALLSGCVTNGEQYQGNVYKADQVNQRQDARTVRILAVLPAKVEVENTQGKQAAQAIGGVLGVIGGTVVGSKLDRHSNTSKIAGAVGGGTLGVVAASAMVQDKILVDGVSITYVEKGKTYTSTQVGRKCEFIPGTAIVISTEAKETRVQPNATCPDKEK